MAVILSVMKFSAPFLCRAVIFVSCFWGPSIVLDSGIVRLYRGVFQSLGFGVAADRWFCLVFREFFASGPSIILSLGLSRFPLSFLLITVACIRFCACRRRITNLLLLVAVSWSLRSFLCLFSDDRMGLYD